MTQSTDTTERIIGLWGATGIGVAAIVGGGILALAGPAFACAGPSATLAVALGGVIAFVTALSFAEMASAFPQSGGAYVFANKVLSVRAAFGVGWVLWFAYAVACVLYALGFAAFAVLILQELWTALGHTPPAWLAGRNMVLFLASGATAYFVLSLIRHTAGGGQWINVTKILLFVVFIAAGAIAMFGRPLTETTAPLDPFFTGGVTGIVHVMGFTFVILHGFEVIAAVAGEVKDPGKTIPRAMFLSLGIALSVYLPLLFVASSVGVPDGLSLEEFSARNPDTLIAAAVREFMGPVGYWLVIICAVLSFLSALHANTMAGSRVALSMARDGTLPRVLRSIDAKHKTPAMAIYATGLAIVAVLFMVPNLEAAGAAASLIFLLSFALAHVMTYLARVRRAPGGNSYRTPWFPLVPVFGGVSCTALAIYEAVAVPAAGAIIAMWLGLGAILYVALFRTHAEAADASAVALDPSLGRLRGKNPLILVPIANPASARCMVEVANALAPSEFARVLLLSVVPAPATPADDPLSKLDDTQKVVGDALRASLAAGYTPDALITTSESPWIRIPRIIRSHGCETLLLGLSEVPSRPGVLSEELEQLRAGLDASVRLLKTGGRLCVISYHSLEDRIVKRFMVDNARRDILKVITKKPRTPSAKELRNNPSSRSAKLRAAEKI